MVGYGLRWNEPAYIGGRTGFEERFRRGAFARSIASGEVVLALEHDAKAIVARQSDGSLTLIEDSVGLRVDAMASYTEAGQDALDSARCRFRAGLSVAFYPVRVEWTPDRSSRIVTACDLIELSVVRCPAYRSSELFAGKMRIEKFEAALPPLDRDRREGELLEREAALAAAAGRH